MSRGVPLCERTGGIAHVTCQAHAAATRIRSNWILTSALRARPAIPSPRREGTSKRRVALGRDVERRVADLRRCGGSRRPPQFVTLLRAGPHGDDRQREHLLRASRRDRIGDYGSARVVKRRKHRDVDRDGGDDGDESLHVHVAIPQSRENARTQQSAPASPQSMDDERDVVATGMFWSRDREGAAQGSEVTRKNRRPRSRGCGSRSDHSLKRGEGTLRVALRQSGSGAPMRLMRRRRLTEL